MRPVSKSLTRSVEPLAGALSLLMQAINSGIAGTELLMRGFPYDALVCCRTSLEQSWRAIHIAQNPEAFRKWKQHDSLPKGKRLRVAESREYASAKLSAIVPAMPAAADAVYDRLSGFAHGQYGHSALGSVVNADMILGGVLPADNRQLYEAGATFLQMAFVTMAAAAERIIWNRPEHLAFWPSA